MIFQDPMASLNERAKVEYIVAEGLLNHHLYKDQNDLHEKVMNALHEVGLLPEFASRFPHEFSGGQRQRIGIARLALRSYDWTDNRKELAASISLRRHGGLKTE